jgi:hypothetical protein
MKLEKTVSGIYCSQDLCQVEEEKEEDEGVVGSVKKFSHFWLW